MEVTERRLKFASSAVLMSLAVLAVLVLTFGILKRHPLRWDTTANREQSLSDQTKNVLKNLRQEVTVAAFFRRGDEIDDVYIRRKVDDLLQEYGSKAKTIHYQMFDPDVNVEQALKYNITTDGTIVFSCGSKRKDIQKSQLFDYSQTTEVSMPAFVGEGAFTNALLSVMEEKQKVVYFLQGHGERPLEGTEPGGFSEVKSSLEKNNYLVRPLSFVTEQKIPEDTDLLIVAGATKSLQPQEDKLISEYAKTGRLLLLLEPATPVILGSTLQDFKVKPENDVVLDPKRHFLLGPHYPAPVLQDHPITKDIKEMNPILSTARSLALMEKSETVQAFLSTSPDAWGETNLSGNGDAKFDASSDIRGPLTLGVAVTRDHPAAVIVGDADFASNGLIQVPGNADLFLNMVSWLVGEENKLAIGPKKTDFRSLSATPGQARFIAYFSQLGYPLLVLAGGLVYWYRRKNR